MDNRILDKVRKLLSLAESDNENEAKLAMEKANEMLLRHNLSLQDVTKPSDVVEQAAGEEFQFSCAEDKFILSILQRFFFVKPIYHVRGTGRVTSAGQRVRMQQLVFVGLPQNVEIATYTYHYLRTSFRRLWLDYKRANSAPEKARQAYYHGLANAITERLTAKKQQVETETGLVWVGDKAIADYLSNVKLKVKSHSKFQGNSSAEQAGKEAGRSLDLLHGLKAKTESAAKGKLIG